MEEIVLEQSKIVLKDIFRFDKLLSKPEFQGKWIKARFNKNWEGYDFVERYVNSCPDFIPWILSRGGDKRSRNQVGEIQFQFIEVEYHKWLFIGAYLILEKDSQVHVNGVRYALAKRLEEYDKYVDKVLVDLTLPSRNWLYTNREFIDHIEVNSVTATSYFDRNVQFPGFENLSLSYVDLKKQFYSPSWRYQLSSVYGVYVLTDMKTGKLYVGSAYGENGLFGRWSAYLANGYDKDEFEDSNYPNKRLRELVNTKGMEYIRKHFRYSVLEIFGKNELGKQKSLAREKYWKQVLGSRYPNGYNDN